MALTILAIESSCDDTSVAVVQDGFVLSNLIANQNVHMSYGGVVPELASRAHQANIVPVTQQALRTAGIKPDEVDAVAFTRGPGLLGSLLVGTSFAKGFAVAENIPLIEVNHLHAHVMAHFILDKDKPARIPELPFLCLLVSGGHTRIIVMKNHFEMEVIGNTIDDAAGEAFDKVARLLGLPYPGGPSIQKAALNGNPQAFNFPRARLEGTWNFSFSGLKTAVLRVVREMEANRRPLPVEDLAASFQAAVVDVLVSKTIAAARAFQAKEVLVAGGVSANRALREAFLGQKEFPVHIPALSLCTDNAAMIAAAGYFRYALGQHDPLNLDVLPTWPLS